MSRLPMPGAMPADVAERMSDRDDTAWEARVDILMRDPDLEAILVQRDRFDLIQLIWELYDQPTSTREYLRGLMQDWAEKRADDEY